MAAIDQLRGRLDELRGELDGLADRRKALKAAIKDVETAISSLEGLDGKGSGRGSSSKARKPKRPTVTPDDLVQALRSHDGSASVEELVATLGIPDGRSLNGARRVAVDEGRVAYQDRTYTLTTDS